MPVSKRHMEIADLRTQVASCLGIDPKFVFFPVRYDQKLELLSTQAHDKPVLAIWTEGWSESEVNRCKALKPKVKALAKTFRAKIYMSQRHPHEQEENEQGRRKLRGKKYRERRIASQENSQSSLKRRVALDIHARIDEIIRGS